MNYPSMGSINIAHYKGCAETLTLLLDCARIYPRT